MKLKYRPTFNRFLIKKLETESGLIARAREDLYAWAEILAIGGMVGKRGEQTFEQFKVGDKVAYHRGAAIEVAIGNDVFTLLDDDKVVAVKGE